MRLQRFDISHRLISIDCGTEERKGEASFETWPEAKRVRPHDRAYPFGCLVQQPNLVEAPAAAFKLPEEEAEGTHHDEIKDFLNVGSTVVHDL